MRLDPTGNYVVPAHPLLAPYAMTVRTDQGHMLELGRFSSDYLARVQILGLPYEGLVFRCGAFCEIAPTAEILVGGGHHNDGLWNVSLLGQAPAFGNFMDAENRGLRGMEPPRPIILGDNVVISAGAMVVDGVEIGTGAVIGAGAVVTKACEPLSVYAGVPARKLRDRLTPERAALYTACRIADLHAHHLPRIPGLMKRLEQGELSISDYLGQISFLRAEPRLHWDATLSQAGRVQLTGVTKATVDGRAVDAATLEAIRTYLSQGGAATVAWTPDIFHTLGLC